MSRPGLWMLCGAVALLGVLLAPVAQAAKCGTAPAGKKAPLLAAGLVLDEEGSTTNLDFGRKTGEKRLILAFAVTGCELKRNAPLVAVPISSDLPDAAFRKAKIEVDPTRVEVRLPVIADEFDPGKYTGSIKVRGPGVVTAIQAVTVQRSEGALLPTLTVIFGWIVGLIFAFFAANASVESSKKLKPSRLFIAVVPAATAAAAVWKTSYGDTEIFNSEFFTYVVLWIAVTSASLGAATPALVGEGAKTDRD